MLIRKATAKTAHAISYFFNRRTMTKTSRRTRPIPKIPPRIHIQHIPPIGI
jgi:hypothetical protein